MCQEDKFEDIYTKRSHQRPYIEKVQIIQWTTEKKQTIQWTKEKGQTI